MTKTMAALCGSTVVPHDTAVFWHQISLKSGNILLNIHMYILLNTEIYKYHIKINKKLVPNRYHFIKIFHNSN